MRLCFQRTKRIYKSILYELSISIRFLGSYPDIYIYSYTSISETTALIFQKYDAAHQILKIQNYIFWNEIYLSLSCIFLSEKREKIYYLYVSLLYREKNLTILYMDLCVEVLTRERKRARISNTTKSLQRNSTPNMLVFIRISIF